MSQVNIDITTATKLHSKHELPFINVLTKIMKEVIYNMMNVSLLFLVWTIIMVDVSNGWIIPDNPTQLPWNAISNPTSVSSIRQQQQKQQDVFGSRKLYDESTSIERGINSWMTLTLSSSTIEEGKTVSSESSVNMLKDGSSLSSLLISEGTQQIQQKQPSKQDIALLRTAFATFYDPSIRDVTKAYQLFTEVISIWEMKQLPANEIFGLYRVRADICMALGNANDATADYSKTIKILVDLLKNSDDDTEEYETMKNELITSTLGRARATKGLAKAANNNNYDSNNEKDNSLVLKYAQQSAIDYERALIMSSRGSADEYDTKDEILLDGSLRNPYAAWEWGTALRYSGQYDAAAKAHLIASQSFQEIGDKSRSVISLTDAGIDYAMAAASSSSTTTSTAGNTKDRSLTLQSEQAEKTLRDAISQTKGIIGSSRDIDLLRRVVAKESEGRIVLASLLWSKNNRQEAETYYGDSCIRLDQLQTQIDLAADKITKQKESSSTSASSKQQGVVNNNNKVPFPAIVIDDNRVLYSIDDEIIVNRGLLSCSNFKNKSFLTKTLQWPQTLQQQLTKFDNLQI